MTGDDARYAVLLRSINVSGRNRVPMADLRESLTAFGLTQVSTYIASGNAVVSATSAPDGAALGEYLAARFGFEIPTLVCPAAQIRAIVAAVPDGWVNDAEQKCDVVFLLGGRSPAELAAFLAADPRVEDQLLVDGALVGRVDRVNQSRARIRNVIASPWYRWVTVRNINTVRAIAARL